MVNLPPYKKDHASPVEIVEILQSRGLIIDDVDHAAKTIEIMGYARLRMYMRSRCHIHREGTPFRKGTTFGDILRIHEFDFELRTACFQAVGKFEILFRNSIAEALGSRYGSHPYKKGSAFRIQKDHKQTWEQFFAEKFKKSKNIFAEEYKREYSKFELPPIWYMKEMLTFGEVAIFFEHLNPKVGSLVAKDFGIMDKHFMRQWIFALVDMRNACVHHDRLFNKVFQKELARFKKRGIPSPEVRTNKLAGLLQCLDYVTRARGAPVEIEKTVRDLVNKYPEISLAEIGLPG